MTDFAPVEPHGSIEEVWDGVYRVRGSVRMGPGLRIPRNMAIIRDGEELTVVSPVRLRPETEVDLEKLGEVKHVVKIGLHGMDDAYYLDRFGATYWALPGMVKEGGPKHEALADGAVPVSDATLFRFEDTTDPEAALLIARDGGILLTCDSVQHWVDTDGCSVPAKALTRVMGFLHPVNIGPPWRKRMTKPGGTLRKDFERLAELPFDHVMGGHGDPAKGGANAMLRATIARVFG